MKTRLAPMLGAALMLFAGAQALGQDEAGAHPSSDPRNISGVWQVPRYERAYRQVDGSLPPFTAKGRADWERHVKAEKDGVPIADAPTRCLPHGIPRLMASPYPIQILQTPGQVTMLHEVAHNIRLIYLDQPHPDDPDPTFLGHSVGKWEGDTLVIDTTALNDLTRIDEEGITHSDQLHVVERIRKINGGRQLENLITITDPVMFERPWTTRRVYNFYPTRRLLEYVCEENNRNEPNEHGITVAK